MQMRWMTGAAVTVAAAASGIFGTVGRTASDAPRPNQLRFENPSGVHATFTSSGSIDVDNPFFQNLGTNGRTCFSCHRPAQAWTVTPDELRERFAETKGLDPIFRANDGSNCEGADITTLQKRRAAFSLLLSKGLIRIGLQVPDGAEFEVAGVDDPYGCGAPLTEVSAYRRPLPAANLGFLATVMWDGRDTVPAEAIRADLATQAAEATTGHAQGAAPSAAQLDDIVDFELGLFTAQAEDDRAGNLSARGATGGPKALSTEPFCIGINDPLNMLPSMPGACATSSGGLDPNVFTAFRAWETSREPARRAIARGEAIFNTRTFVIDNVGGLNGGPQDPVPGPIPGGTCTLCHDTPNAGNHSISMALNLGLTDAPRRTADLPLYTLQRKGTGELVQTTDPGRAMITGKWADIGKFKGPILRALAARAPYFHNGSAASLEEAVDFYNTRFNIGLTAQEKSDLVAFLKAL